MVEGNEDNSFEGKEYQWITKKKKLYMISKIFRAQKFLLSIEFDSNHPEKQNFILDKNYIIFNCLIIYQIHFKTKIR